MSNFYESLDWRTSRQFKARKKRFKHGKPCAICGKKYPEDQMMVAHKKPARELSDWDALYDQTNWEVRCIYCEQRMNKIEDRAKQDLLNKQKELIIDDKEDSQES